MSKRQRFDSELLGSSFAHNAETAIVAAPVARNLNLLTPCHREPLRFTIGGFSGEVEFWCPAEGCYNTWDNNGDLDS